LITKSGKRTSNNPEIRPPLPKMPDVLLVVDEIDPEGDEYLGDDF
jgi:hypothetical protein